MSYNHQNIDNWITAPAGASLTALVDPLVTGMVNYRPGYQPGMAVAIYALVITAPTVTAPSVTFKFRPTIGSATGEVTIGTLTFALATALINTVVFKTVDNVKLTPGGEVVVQVTAVATAGAAQFGILVAPNWDYPANNLKMVRSA
jgi:hypothetical protein